MTARNHFITVARDGRLMARRAGAPPVVVCRARDGLVVRLPPAAVAGGVPAEVRVYFAHGGGNRRVNVTEVATPDERMEVGRFQERYDVSDLELGRLMRTAVDELLDSAVGPGAGGSRPGRAT